MHGRVLLSFSIALATALPCTAQLIPVEQDCTASAELTLSDAFPESAPQCTFDLLCPNASGCFYVVTLDVGGTGQVSGTMSAENGGLGTGVAFVDAVTEGAAPDPACGPALFHCSYATKSDNLVVLFVPGAAVVTCSGGGVAAFETVACSASTEL